MAVTTYPTGHPLAVKLFSKELMTQVLRMTYVSRFIGTTADSMIQVKDETKKSAGDKITYGLKVQLGGTGVAGDDTLEGNEEALVTYSDSILIDQLRHATRSKGKMSEQRVLFSLREEGKQSLGDWFADRVDTAFFNHLGGISTQTDGRYTGSNTPIAPSTNNIVLSNQTAEGSLTTTDAFTTSLIDKCVARAKTMQDQSTPQPNIRPIKVNGQPKYVMFLHPWQVYSLRTTATAATVTWWEVNRSALTGGMIKDNPIYTGSLGEYNGVILHESQRVPNSTTANAKRAIFCGAQSAVIAYGRDTSSPTRMSWREEEFDYGNQLGISAGMVWGLKKVVFNSADFGCIIAPSYAVSP